MLQLRRYAMVEVEIMDSWSGVSLYIFDTSSSNFYIENPVIDPVMITGLTLWSRVEKSELD